LGVGSQSQLFDEKQRINKPGTVPERTGKGNEY
jgi:hypothetical protein